MVAEEKPQNNFVYSYDPVNFPTWVWALLLSVLFFIFVSGIYYASRGISSMPDISNRQIEISGGYLRTPGFA